jgi:hypothetical protein
MTHSGTILLDMQILDINLHLLVAKSSPSGYNIYASVTQAFLQAPYNSPVTASCCSIQTSGRRCRNTSPNRHPTAKLSRTRKLQAPPVDITKKDLTTECFTHIL